MILLGNVLFRFVMTHILHSSLLPYNVYLFVFLFVSIFTQLKYGKGMYFMNLQLHIKSVLITTKVVSSNPTHREVISIQHYVIKFVCDLWQVIGFILVLQFSPPIKLSATILLKVVLNTIIPVFFWLIKVYLLSWHENNWVFYFLQCQGQHAQITQALKAINTDLRFGLTGTALQNDMIELWCILDW